MRDKIIRKNWNEEWRTSVKIGGRLADGRRKERRIGRHEEEEGGLDEDWRMGGAGGGKKGGLVDWTRKTEWSIGGRLANGRGQIEDWRQVRPRWQV